MDSYKKINRTFELISIGISAITTKAIIDWLQGLIVQKPVILTLTLVLVYLLNEVFVWIFKSFFSNFEIFRKYTFREEFVEGVWIEFLTENDQIQSVGIVIIKADKEGQGLRVSGDNYKYSLGNKGNNLSLNYSFYSKDELTKFKFPTLDFAYINKYKVAVNGRQSIEGVAQLTFSSIQGIPLRYHASFNLAEDDPKTVGLEGRKIQDNNDLKYIKNDSINSRIIEKYIKKREEVN